MKERPIIFSGAMVRAILDGNKTMTRRPVKGKQIEWLDYFGCNEPFWNKREKGVECPYGEIGDRLWVRETWVPPNKNIGDTEMTDLCYKATNNKPEMLRWKPAIHMPRKASRITLEITKIRAQMLQEISTADAIAEGATKRGNQWSMDWSHKLTSSTARIAFANYICRLYGSNHCDDWYDLDLPEEQMPIWHKNPWFWGIKFKRI